MKEFELINQYLFPNKNTNLDILLNIGDDAAIIKKDIDSDFCISADMLIENKHFFSDVKANDLAYKILAVNLSDIAAMGAIPKYILLSMGLSNLDKAWIDDFFKEIFKLSKEYKFELIGGDTTKSDFKAFNITIIGSLPKNKALKRSGAKVGDDIWVSGMIGLAEAALLDHFGKIKLDKDTYDICENKRLRPIPKIDLGHVLLDLANSAIDLSDGFSQDLGHILELSKVGAIVNIDKLPSLDRLRKYPNYYDLVAAGGDEYELIFTASQENREKIIEIANKLDVLVTRVGKIIAEKSYKLYTDNNEEINLKRKGFDHFGA